MTPTRRSFALPLSPGLAPVRTAATRLPRLRVLALAALLGQPLLAGAADAPATTLPEDATATVQVRSTGAGTRADVVPDGAQAPPLMALPEAAEAIEGKVLPGLLVIGFSGNERWQHWSVRSSEKLRPDFFIERVIARMMVAGFGSVATCPGHDWSGTRGNRRADLRVIGNAVSISLVPAPTPCLATGPTSP